MTRVGSVETSRCHGWKTNTCLFGLFAFVSVVFAQQVGPVPNAVRKEFKLDPFYQQHIDVDGFPIVGSTNVSAYALREAAWIVRQMLTNRADILHALATNRVRLGVMAWNEFTTDVPEHSDLESKAYWDRRARGLGATRRRPAVSCAEENLLCYPGDPYSTENILIHEFAHAIHEMALNTLDASFEKRLRAAYKDARAAGLWKGTYAATSPSEYWAESVQCWFDDNRENDALHNHVNTRAELKAYDPDVSHLCAEVFGDTPWRYLRPARRAPADRAHLVGYEAGSAPRFKWRAAPIPEKPRVSIQTGVGDIEVELYPAKAPLTVTNFLRYVAEGFYNDGEFFRTVTMRNQPTNRIKIEVVQARGHQAKTNEFFPPVQLERTRDTALKHLDGVISMARFEPDTAQESFFICIGDQPELDYGGKRNPDRQGFAAFGRVTKGMDVVRQIQNSSADGQTLTPPVRIQRAIRLN
ncbi:MAG: peptidylprolyl isomerase [Verrucomicrobia subdivision 3 bacterium]|nr:peptidylprolyl isomerase [Limisphaerales bacterium]